MLSWIGSISLLVTTLLRIFTVSSDSLDQYVESTILLFAALFICLDALDVEAIERNFRFMKLFSGKAGFYLLLSAVILAKTDNKIWTKLLGIYYLIFSMMLFVFGFLSVATSYDGNFLNFDREGVKYEQSQDIEGGQETTRLRGSPHKE